jgi:hypothetical protein
MKNISHRNTKYKLGHLSISADQLIEILERHEFKRMRVNTDSVEFKDLDDVKKYKSHLSDVNMIFCDEVIITFNKSSTDVYLAYDATENDVAVAKSIATDLKAHKKPSDYATDFGSIIFFVWGIFLTKLLLDILIDKDTLTKIITSFEFYVTATLTAITIFLTINYYSKKPVNYIQQPGFLSRNFDGILMTAISSVISLLVAALWKYVPFSQ